MEELRRTNEQLAEQGARITATLGLINATRTDIRRIETQLNTR